MYKLFAVLQCGVLCIALASPLSVVISNRLRLTKSGSNIGGIKEKLIGALSAGVKKVLLPVHNRKDVRELPEEVKTGLEIIYMRYEMTRPMIALVGLETNRVLQKRVGSSEVR